MIVENLIPLITGMVATAFAIAIGRRAGRNAHDAPEPALAPISDADAALLEWAHATRLSVIAVSGTHFEMSLAELHASDHPGLRTWNVPVSVALYDPRDRETMEFHQYGRDASYG